MTSCLSVFGSLGVKLSRTPLDMTSVIQKRTLLFFTDHRMKRDHKRRQIVAKHAAEMRAIKSILVAEDLLPAQFRYLESKFNLHAYIS